MTSKFKTPVNIGSALTACILLGLAAVCIVLLGMTFKSANKEELIVRGPGVTEVALLSNYFPDILGTAADTEVYIMKGAEPGPSALVLGGTHPNEPSGVIGAVMLIENAEIESGTLYVIPRTNHSAFTTTDPQEASPMTFTIDTPGGERVFRFGSRATNPIHQWPDPEIYVHASSGQRLSGSETRNINRTYPGRANGNFTEKASYAITQMIIAENIDVTIDLHEAAPEYPTNNALVAHEDGTGTAAFALMYMQMEGMEISLEASPKDLHGLTHRELGDYTDTQAFLMETPNASQGRLRGHTDEELVVDGKDKFYEMAAEYGNLYVPWDENGHPLVNRVARHLTGITQLIRAFNEQGSPEGQLVINNIPSYSELIETGLGAYLNPSKGTLSSSVISAAPKAETKTEPEAKSAATVSELILIEPDIPSSRPIEGTITDEWVTNGAWYPDALETAAIDTYAVCPGTEMEAEVTVITGAEPGPAIYIVASVHGDEIAAYNAANNLKNMEVKKGTLYILSPANVTGAENRRRYVINEEDLNRSFPGDPEGNKAEQLADAIYKDIEDKSPDLVMDLHEAIIVEENRDFLGSSLIFTSLDDIADMFLNMLTATQEGELASEKFNYFGPGPIGSINNTVTNNLGIPAITVETFRAYPLERRVMDQLAILGYIFNYYGMI